MKVSITQWIYDPPSGWMYGFPAPLPPALSAILDGPRSGQDEQFSTQLQEWMRSKGYPEKNLEWASGHGRMWQNTIEVDDGEDS